jgi:hypothetical protein
MALSNALASDWANDTAAPEFANMALSNALATDWALKLLVTWATRL